jgi:hypothetical protein
MYIINGAVGSHDLIPKNASSSCGPKENEL